MLLRGDGAQSHRVEHLRVAGAKIPGMLTAESTLIFEIGHIPAKLQVKSLIVAVD